LGLRLFLLPSRRWHLEEVEDTYPLAMAKNIAGRLTVSAREKLSIAHENDRKATPPLIAHRRHDPGGTPGLLHRRATDGNKCANYIHLSRSISACGGLWTKKPKESMRLRLLKHMRTVSGSV
jgi:hypothetical protein